MTDETKPPFDLGAMMAQARRVKEQLQKAREQAAHVELEGQAGGGLVIVRANGLGRITRVIVDPTLIETRDREMVEDLVVVATNQALEQAQHTMQSDVVQGLGLPIPPELLRSLL